MALAQYTNFQINLVDPFTGQALQSSGGKVIVCASGATKKATLYDPANNYAALANGVAISGGHIQFALSGSPIGQVVDLYGMTPEGRFFVARGCKPGNPTEIPVDSNRRDQVAIIPFDFGDAGAGTEYDTGIVLPTGALVLERAAIKVTTVMAGKTMTVGLLSSQSGGNAAGFLNGVSLATLSTVKGTLASAGVTLGSLLQVTATAGAEAEPYVVGSTAINVSYTLGSGSTAGGGFIALAYSMPAS